MKSKIEAISPSEWELMRVIWTKGQVTSRELIDTLQMKRDWSDSTIKTLIRRLSKKDFVSAEKQHGCFVFQARIQEKEAMNASAEALFHDFCAMNRGQTLVDLIQELPLSRRDVQELQTVLTKKMANAPEKVPCNCLPAKAHCQDCEVTSHEA